MSENTEPTETPAPPNSMTPTPLTRRNIPSADRAMLPPDMEEQFNHLLQSVQVLSAHFFGDAAPPLESLKERTARRVKKFQRAGGDERGPTSAPGEEGAPEALPESAEGPTLAHEESPERLALNKNIAWPRQNAASEGIAPEPPGRHWWQRRVGVWVGAQAFGLILLVTGYLIGHLASSSRYIGTKTYGHTTADLFGQSELSEQALQIANEGLHAERTGDTDGARKIYETASQKHVELAGINYRLALIAVQSNDLLAAEQCLERSTLNGEYVPECCYVLSRLAADKGDFEEATNQLQRAAKAEPFDGKYFFYWGEMLRRQGKPQAAVTAFDQAMDRPYTAEIGDLYLFKQRLAKVEYGHDEAFNAELASHLKQEPVAGEWMLLAAAQDLDHQGYAAAAEHLKLAEDRLPSGLYATLSHDYFFQMQGKRPEIASLLNRTAPVVISSAGPTVLDPGSWTPDRGDPAVWPTSSNPAGH